MTEKSSLQILGGNSESPRISFSRDFVQADQKRMRVKEHSHSASTDFEFSMAATFNPSGSYPTTVDAMLPADELICDGKLLPFAHSGDCAIARHSFSTFYTTPLRASAFLPSSSPPPSLSSSSSSLATLREVSPASLSANVVAPKCGVKWRELFQFRTKFQYEREKENRGLSTDVHDCEEKGSSKLTRLFSRSRSVSRGREMDRRLAIAHEENAAKSFAAYKSNIISEGSSPQKHSPKLINLRFDYNNAQSVDSDGLIDREGRFESPARLSRQFPEISRIDQASKSTIKSSWTASPRRIFTSSKIRKTVNSESKCILKKFSFMRNVKKGSTARHATRIVMKTTGKCSSSRSRNNSSSTCKTEIHRRQAEMDIGWGDQYWRIGHQYKAAEARVSPVLLNVVPTCMAPSLRSVKVSKAKLLNLRHLFSGSPRTTATL